jgi:hypothetical protein
MDREALLALGDYLKQSITFRQGPRVGMILPQVFQSEGCDHTLDRTIEWLHTHVQNVEAAVRWLKERGGTCDCTVITNVIWRLDEEL